jgi:hypothetical protein
MNLVDLTPLENKKAENLTKKYNQLIEESAYNRKRIFARARYIYRTTDLNWSEALKQSWDESKKVVLEARAELMIVSDKMLNLNTPGEYVNPERGMAEAFELNTKFYR